VEDDIRKLEQDRAIARAELESLENAKLPLELRELELELEDARRRLEEESSYLADSRALAKNRMVSDQEVAQQQRKVLNLEAEVEKISLETRLTRDYLQPAALAKARTAVFTAEQALEVAREQLANSVISAPRDGVVVYNALSVGGEYRRIRIGDAIYPNQPFMVLPDMDNLVTVVEVPEAELQNLELGALSLVQPIAYPGLRLRGEVERIGAVAQSLPGRPDWQKFFSVSIGIVDRDSRVRPGMSAVAEVIAHYVEDALLVPRRALRFDGERAVATVREGGESAPREVSVGRHDAIHFEVLGGLAEGERVLLH
jgi:HlyD family secretion protein